MDARRLVDRDEERVGAAAADRHRDRHPVGPPDRGRHVGHFHLELAGRGAHDASFASALEAHDVAGGIAREVAAGHGHDLAGPDA